MNISYILKRGEKALADNSPQILTTVGVVGTLTTAYLTGKASFKAADIIAMEEVRISKEPRVPLTNGERFQLVWKLYIPAASSALLTATAIVGATQIGTRRAAAMAAAYSMSRREFADYQEKIVEKLGEKKEREARDELAQERINRNPVGNQQVFVTGGGEVLCYDTWTGRYFMSDMETLKAAQNQVNYQVLNSYYASLSDFYNAIGLPNTKNSDDFGWNSDKLLELTFSTTMSDENKPCIAIDFQVEPIRGYSRVH